MAAIDAEDVVEGEVVVVVGASGRVGRAVTESLAATGRYRVRGLVRNLEKAREAFSGVDGVDLEEGNIQDESSLGAAMKDAACVVTCTGTTAFPSARWGGGNTPDAVDNIAVGNMLRAAADAANHPNGGKLKRFVLLSSVGVERRDNFPFFILNAFGVLDAKAKGEEAVRNMAGELGFDYSIVRPGQLPETEGKEDNPAKSMVSVKQGDSEAGAVGLASVAATIVQAVQQSGAAGKSYTVVNVKGASPSQDDWDRMFSEL